MSTTIFVWHRAGENIGHAAIKVADTYMSWWPSGDGTKLDMFNTIYGTGGAVRPPNYDDDVAGEGGNDPDYQADHFGWDDGGAIAFWNNECVPNFLKAVSANRGRKRPQKYQFIMNNCSTLVIEMLRRAGAFNGEFSLNLWLGLRNTVALTPKDVYRTSEYLLGNKWQILNALSPVPDA